LPTTKLAKHGWKLIFLAITAFYLFGLGALPLVGPDEPRYAQVAREMFARRDLITPTLGGHPWFEKPPLLYWLMMTSYRLVGVTEYAARLGPAICGLLTGVSVLWLGKSVERTNATTDPKNATHLGEWSALVYLSSFGAIAFSRAASFDIVLTMTLTGALSCFFLWHIGGSANLVPLSASGEGLGERRASIATPPLSPHRERGGAEFLRSNAKRSALLAAFYFFVGLSLLAKGLVGIVLPFGIIGAYFLILRERPTRKFAFSLLWGLPIALIVAASWYGPMIYRHGWTFIDQFIVEHHFARFLSNKYHHPQPFYFYVPVVLLMVLPWAVVLIAGLITARRWNWRGKGNIDLMRVFTLAWVVIPVVFFSLSKSKIPGYVLPVLPATALLIGERVNCFVQANRGQRVIRLTGVLILIGVAAGAWYSVREVAAPLWLITAVGGTIATVAIVAMIVPRPRVSFLLFAAIPLVTSVWALKPAARLANRDSVRDLIHAAYARSDSSAPVFYLLCDDRSAEFYASGRLAYDTTGEPIRFEGAQDVAAAIRQKGGSGLVLIETRWEQQLTDYRAVATEKIADNGWISIFAVRVR
jgi:4-amino-4-deoxy-L-arabinose transferase-like glycosyltransferase